MRGETFNCGECWCVVSNQYLEDHHRVCPGPNALTAAKQEWMDEAMKRVAEAVRGAAIAYNSGGSHPTPAWEVIADLLSPPPPKAPSVPEVNWKNVDIHLGRDDTDNYWSDVAAFARFMASTPGAKVVVEPCDE